MRAWRWLKPPMWLRLALRRRTARENRRIASLCSAYDSPDPDMGAKWANEVAKVRSSHGLTLDGSAAD